MTLITRRVRPASNWLVVSEQRPDEHAALTVGATGAERKRDTCGDGQERRDVTVLQSGNRYRSLPIPERCSAGAAPRHPSLSRRTTRP